MNGTNYEVLHCGAFSTPHSHLSWIRLSILFSNTLSLHSSLNVRNHVSLPYSTTGDNVLYTLILKSLERSQVFEHVCYEKKRKKKKKETSSGRGKKWYARIVVYLCYTGFFLSVIWDEIQMSKLGWINVYTYRYFRRKIQMKLCLKDSLFDGDIFIKWSFCCLVIFLVRLSNLKCKQQGVNFLLVNNVFPLTGLLIMKLQIKFLALPPFPKGLGLEWTPSTLLSILNGLNREQC